jgi:hypothetical protein
MHVKLYANSLEAQTYLVDAFPLHSASALAGGSILRFLAGAFLPLAGPPLNKSVRYGWGNSILSFYLIGFHAGATLHMKYRERLRQRSKDEKNARA